MLKIEITSYDDVSERFAVKVDDEPNGTMYSTQIGAFLMPYIAPKIVGPDSDDPRSLIGKSFTLTRNLCDDFGA
jgi:hypothetical protein